MEKMINGIKIIVVDGEWDVYFDMALKMLEEIMTNNSLGKNTVMIVPVGPTQQYPILARLVNQLNVSLKNVWFFNMDEYMVDEFTCIDSENDLSFHKRMELEFYSRVKAELLMPESQRKFPIPGKEKEYDNLIKELGGVDLCLGGLGINGHIAFNEPAEIGDKITAEEYASLGTRVLPVSRETQAINAYGYKRGDLRAMPTWCITVGMKQILESRKIYIALNRDWQHGIVKHVLSDAPQPQIPATLLQGHKNVEFCMHKGIANNLF